MCLGESVGHCCSRALGKEGGRERERKKEREKEREREGGRGRNRERESISCQKPALLGDVTAVSRQLILATSRPLTHLKLMDHIWTNVLHQL